MPSELVVITVSVISAANAKVVGVEMVSIVIVVAGIVSVIVVTDITSVTVVTVVRDGAAPAQLIGDMLSTAMPNMSILDPYMLKVATRSTVRIVRALKIF
jgi:hypothetical protein